MSSHARPCYQNLSQYTENGMNPIIAPQPAETRPMLFNQITPMKFSQSLYKQHQKLYGKTATQADNKSNCIGYSNFSQLGCGLKNSDGAQFANHYNFEPGFNEVGVSKFY